MVRVVACIQHAGLSSRIRHNPTLRLSPYPGLLGWRAFSTEPRVFNEVELKKKRKSAQVSVFRNRIVVRNPGTLPVELTKADLMKEHGSYPHNPYMAEVLYQMGYIEKYGTGITENIRRMQEARLLAPEIDLSTEFITTIWRDNDATESSNVATNIGTNDSTNDIDNTLVDKPNDIANVATGNTNVATGYLNVATDHLAENKRIVDEIVKRKVHSKMSPAQIKECIIEACIVEHSIEELALLLNKTPAHLRNRFIPNLVADGILLPTKPRHTKGQTYMTNPKLDK